MERILLSFPLRSTRVYQHEPVSEARSGLVAAGEAEAGRGMEAAVVQTSHRHDSVPVRGDAEGVPHVGVHRRLL